jgi:hypothetical protein
MKYKVIMILSLGLLLGPLAAHAGDAGDDLSSQLQQKIEPGEWQMQSTTQIEVQGTNMQMPPRKSTVKKCIKKEDIKKIAAPKMPNMDCKLTKKDIDGDTFHFALKCSGQQGNITANGKTVFQSKTENTSHITMRGTLQNMPMTVTVDGTSKRLGDCKTDSGDK